MMTRDMPPLVEATERRAGPPQRIAALWPSPAWLVVALTVLGAVTRFYHLGSRSLWLDETYTAQSVRFPTLGGVMTWTSGDPDQMPLMNLLAWMLRGFGGSEWSVRLPSALAGTLDVLAIYYLATRLFRPRVGLVAALLVAILPFSVWYGQEARPYALLMLLATLQILFSYRAAVYARARDWGALVLVTVLNLYTHYLSLFTTAAAYAFIGVALLMELAGAAIDKRPPPDCRRAVMQRLARKAGAAVVAAAVTTAAYLPWLPYLVTFLGRRDLGFNRFATSHQATLAEVPGLMAAFNLSGPVLVLLCIGIVAVIVRATRGHWLEGGLLLLWLAIPLTGFWLKLHGAIVTVLPRYFSFLFPEAVLVTAAGVEAVAQVTARALSAVARNATGVVSAAITALLLVQVLPLLAQSYQTPKDDYRDAAAYIIARSPPDSVVIAMGNCNLFIVQSLGYYLWQRHSSITVIDGTRVDDRVALGLQRRKGRVWGAIFTHCFPPNSLDRLSTAGLAVTQFVGIALVRQRAPAATVTAQTRALLRWGSPRQPQLLATLDLLDILRHNAALGANLLPAPGGTGAAPLAERWVLTRGAALAPDHH
ncbi:MAG TPA: glycosyltransferase family 39 protein, partial [Chloroflexota bacterium]|nr:glycosyltransferase family 39 protein [Chloroflexota bacterium]